MSITSYDTSKRRSRKIATEYKLFGGNLGLILLLFGSWECYEFLTCLMTEFQSRVKLQLKVIKVTIIKQAMEDLQIILK